MAEGLVSRGKRQNYLWVEGKDDEQRMKRCENT
jgi:hypothetical protein